MEAKDQLETWQILKEFGFHWDLKADNSIPPGPSDDFSGLYFDFGNLKLRASLQVNLNFKKVVLVTWEWARPPFLAMCLKTDFELPRRVESRELCAALIVYYLDKRASTGESNVFIPTRNMPWWLEMGWKNRHLLPWERRKEAYENRPQCTVEKAQLKPVLKMLEGVVMGMGDDASKHRAVLFWGIRIDRSCLL